MKHRRLIRKENIERQPRRKAWADLAVSACSSLERTAPVLAGRNQLIPLVCGTAYKLRILGCEVVAGPLTRTANAEELPGASTVIQRPRSNRLVAKRRAHVLLLATAEQSNAKISPSGLRVAAPSETPTQPTKGRSCQSDDVERAHRPPCRHQSCGPVTALVARGGYRARQTQRIGEPGPTRLGGRGPELRNWAGAPYDPQRLWRQPQPGRNGVTSFRVRGSEARGVDPTDVPSHALLLRCIQQVDIVLVHIGRQPQVPDQHFDIGLDLDDHRLLWFQFNRLSSRICG